MKTGGGLSPFAATRRYSIVVAVVGRDYGVMGHMSSLKPLNPANTPEDWERKALLAFEQGVTEVSEVAKVDGKSYLRLMRPVVTQKGCLTCHAAQGYQEGDIRGGLSVTLPIESLLRAEGGVVKDIGLSHGIIWLMGIGGIGFVFRRSRSYVVEREKTLLKVKESEESLRKTNEVLEKVFSLENVMIAYLDRNFNFIRVNQSYASAAEGRPPEYFVGKNHFELYPNAENEVPKPVSPNDLLRKVREVLDRPSP